MEHAPSLAAMTALARPQSDKFDWRRMAAPVANWVSRF
jgi:hypothetical protein